MHYDLFKRIVTESWDRALQRYPTHFRPKGKYQMVYPTTISFFRTRHQYCYELHGISSKPVKLKQTTRNVPDINSYFSLFPKEHAGGDGVCVMDCENSSLNGMRMATKGFDQKSAARFPILDQSSGIIVNVGSEGGPLVKFGRNSHDCVLNDVQMISAHKEFVRFRYVQYFHIIQKSTEPYQLKSLLEGRFAEQFNSPEPIGYGLIFTLADVETATHASIFQSLFLTKGVHETTIGAFLDENPQFLYTGLDAINHVYEPYLPWIEHDGTVTEQAINPDLFFQRTDGTWHILDLKTAALSNANLTKGKRSRRRFIDLVNEGLTQLKNYEWYFQYPANAELAKEKYGVEIISPSLVLVVGNQENFTTQEVDEAFRVFGDHQFTIVDYDTLALGSICRRNENL